MLSEIRLENFKCFENVARIPVGKINLFTGINGRGKSTVLQALLLMRQSLEHSRTTNKIVFNGSCVEIGNFHDVKNSNVSRKKAVELMFRFQDNTHFIEFHYFLRENSEDNMVADVQKIISNWKINGEEDSFEMIKKGDSYVLDYLESDSEVYLYNLLPDVPDDKAEVFKFIRNNVEFTRTHYISADRIGPQDYYPKQSFPEFPNVGNKGQYAANMLSKKKNDRVYKELCLEKGETHTVLHQTEAWLSSIFRGGNIDVRPLEANIVIMVMNSEDSKDLYKPVNVGFGYSYTLPIIVAGLIAKKGEILIVENPEAHLHPSAQSQLARFLTKVSKCGVQVFIESHSDHILNGLRIAVRDKVIRPDDLNILYFQREQNYEMIRIPVNSDGSIEEWPNGFFDQTEKDFERLFGV